MKAIRHIGIVVSDMERALRFYRDFLGLRIVNSARESGPYLEQMLALPGVRVHTAKLSAGANSTLVELLAFESHRDRPVQSRRIHSIGPTHVAFTVDNVDREYERLLQQGVCFNSPPQRTPDGYAKVTFCRDPDGMPVELVEVLG